MKTRWPATHILELATYSRAGEVIDKSYWGKGAEILYTCAKDPVRSDYSGFPEDKRTVSGDILLARNGYGYAYFPAPGSIYTNVVQRVQIDQKRAHPKYIWYILNSKIDQLRGVGQGIPSLNMSVWNVLDIPLPPLSIQHEIVSTLDAADSLKRKREEVANKMETFALALFHEMFGDSRKNEKGWTTKTLGEIAGNGQYGLNAAASNNAAGIRFIRITDIDDKGRLGRTEPVFAPLGSAAGEYKLHSGDILIARSGATAGKVYLHRDTKEEMVFAGYLIRFVPKMEQVLPEFLFQFLQTEEYWRQIKIHKRAVAQPNVNARQLASLRLPVPPLELQKLFIERITSAIALRDKQVESQKKLSDVFRILVDNISIEQG